MLFCGHHGAGHLALEGIAVLEDPVSFIFGVSQTLQHVAGSVDISGLVFPAVPVERGVVFGILENKRRRGDIDGDGIRVVEVGGGEGGRQGQSLDRCVRIRQIGGHLIQAVYIHEGGDDFPERFYAGGVASVPVQPHVIVILHQFLAVCHVRVGEGDIALQDILQLGIDRQLPLRKGVVGDIAGRDRACGKPAPVDSGVKIFCQGVFTQLLAVFDEIRAEPVVGTRLLGGIRLVVGESQQRL